MSCRGGHVGGDGDAPLRPAWATMRDSPLVLLGVEDLVRDSGFLQDFGDGFGFFDGDGTDENRLARS